MFFPLVHLLLLCMMEDTYRNVFIGQNKLVSSLYR